MVVTSDWVGWLLAWLLNTVAKTLRGSSQPFCHDHLCACIDLARVSALARFPKILVGSKLSASLEAK